MKNSDRPAFAHPGFKLSNVDTEKVPASEGLSKREYFTAVALQGLLAGNYSYYHGNSECPVPEHIAEAAVKIADITLLQLEKK